jgi:hypothetical protein
MSEDLGTNLSPYMGLEFLTGSSPEELLAQLRQIKIQYKILAIYAQGPNHVAWVDTGALKIKKVKLTKRKE